MAKKKSKKKKNNKLNKIIKYLKGLIPDFQYNKRAGIIAVAGLVVLIMAINIMISPTAKVGYVKEVYGKVLIDNKDAKKGMSFYNNSVLVTKVGFAELYLKGKGTIKISRQTTFKGSESVGKGDYELPRGSILAKISKKQLINSFEVHTPSAIVGVRGTTFVINAEKESTEVGVIEGAVKVKGTRGGKQIVRKNQKVEVEKGKRPGKPEYYNGKEALNFWQRIVAAFRRMGDKIEENRSERKAKR